MHFAHVADERKGAAAELRGLAHEERVGRRADADGEQAPVAEAGVEQRQDPVLVADRAIGEEHHLPRHRRLPVARERQFERGQHLGAAACPQPAHEALRAFSVVRVERHRGGEQGGALGIEFDDVEAVACLQAVEGEQQCLACLRHRHAFH